MDVNLSFNQHFAENFHIIKGTPNQKYKLTAEITGIKGIKYSAYIGIVILDENDKELTRKIQWLNDFSNKKYKKSIIFSFPPKGKKFVCILRANKETPTRSDCHFKINFDKPSKVPEDTKEDFDLTKNFKIPLFQNLTLDEENILEKNLVWIIGPPRGGTSWLGTQLLSYETLSWNEPQIGLHLGMRNPRIKEKIVRHIDIFRNEPDYFFSEQYEKTWMYYLRKLILQRTFSQFPKLDTKIIIKEPNGSAGIDFVMKCLPKSKIIFLIRDGRDATDSKLDSFKKESWATRDYGYTPITEKQRPSEILYQAQLWVRMMEILEETFNNHSPSLRMMVKYEDLLRNTLEELKKIYDFIDIEIPQRELKKIVKDASFEKIPKRLKGAEQVTRSAQPGKWKESFSDEEKQILDDVMGPMLKKFGY